MQRGLKGSCPIRAGKIVALLLQRGCQDHADLVGVMRSKGRPSPLPEQPRAYLVDTQPAHLPEPDIWALAIAERTGIYLVAGLIKDGIHS